MQLSMQSLREQASQSPEQAIKVLAIILKELKRRTETNALDTFYPDTGPLRRELYVKHIKMLEAGAVHNERCCLGGNRVGKTASIGSYETTLHLTGAYPAWWKGRRYNKQILAWGAGTVSKKVRDVNQKMLCGEILRDNGTPGMIPWAKLVRFTRKSGIADAIDQIVVRHVKGWDNTLTLKSYEEGRTSFEAEAVDWIWLDEEPPKDVYDECKLRLLTTRGAILSTFTPLNGMSEVVMKLLEGSDLLA